MTNGRVCPVCHNWIGENMPHVCTHQFPIAAPLPGYAPHAPGAYNWVPPPVSADDIRKIVREEIERRFPPDHHSETV